MQALADPVFGPVLGLGLVAAGASDLARRRVPNTLNLAIALTGLTWQVARAGLGGLGTGALGMATGFALVLVPFALRLYRGGDAKLVMALGAWLGPAGTLWMFLWGVAFGGVLALVVWALSGSAARRRIARNLQLAAATQTLPAVEAGRPSRQHVPMALAFGAGAVAAWWWG